VKNVNVIINASQVPLLVPALVYNSAVERTCPLADAQQEHTFASLLNSLAISNTNPILGLCHSDRIVRQCSSDILVSFGISVPT
jgi:hypothetical protein